MSIDERADAFLRSFPKFTEFRALVVDILRDLDREDEFQARLAERRARELGLAGRGTRA